MTNYLLIHYILFQMKFILLKLKKPLISNYNKMNELQKNLQNAIQESNHIQKIKLIEKKFNKSKQLQNLYSFPRNESSSSQFSIATSSFQHESYQNLHKQNQKVSDNNSLDSVKKNAKRKRLKLNKQNQVIHILQVKKIKQYTKNCTELKKEGLQLTKLKRQSSEKVIKLYKSLKYSLNNINIFNSPLKNNESQTFQTNTKSKKKRKLMVLTAHKIRRIQNFNIGNKSLSPKKGLTLLCSKQKIIRTININ